jgi:general secretion pathway protein A
MHTPDGSTALPSSLTYEPHYGLAEKPFSLTVNPKFLYKSPTHRVAFDRLLAGIRRREGLIVLTGEVGTGKTTVCRAVVDALDRRTFSAFVPDPFVTREDLLKAVLNDFGVVSADDIKAGRLQGASRQDLSHLLYQFLHSIAPLDAFAVIVVDEAQNLSLPVLEEIRILTELEAGERMLQVVLVGQPELRAHLQLPEMRQMNQRVSVRAELSPLDAEGVALYVAHRLGIAARESGSRVTFTPGALDAVWRASAGVPRLVNKICDRSLEDGYASGVAAIDVAQVMTALGTLDLPPVAAPPSGYAVPVGLVPARMDAPALGAVPGQRPAPAAIAGSPAPIVLTAGDDDAGLDAFASEGAEATPQVASPLATPVKRIRPLTLPTLFESHAPALGRTADTSQGWLTKLWRASLVVVVLGGALATQGVLDSRVAPWRPAATSLPSPPPSPATISADPATRPRLTTGSASSDAPAMTTAGPANVVTTPLLDTSASEAAMRADIEVYVTAPAPDAVGASPVDTGGGAATLEGQPTTSGEAVSAARDVAPPETAVSTPPRDSQEPPTRDEP